MEEDNFDIFEMKKNVNALPTLQEVPEQSELGGQTEFKYNKDPQDDLAHMANE